MRDFMRKRLIENPGFANDEALCETAVQEMENAVFEKGLTPNVYRNTISGITMQIIRANKAKTPFDYKTAVQI